MREGANLFFFTGFVNGKNDPRNILIPLIMSKFRGRQRPIFTNVQTPQILADYGVIFWTTGSARSLGDWLKGSEVDFPVTLSNEFNYKGKKREAINPEPGTLNLLTQTERMSNLLVIPRSIKFYGFSYLRNNRV